MKNNGWILRESKAHRDGLTGTGKPRFKYTFRYFDEKTGAMIRDTVFIERASKLRIPPAYHDVHINKDSNAKLQAYGYDDKGRKQYIYHADFIKKQTDAKFERMKLLDNTIARIWKDINRSLKLPNKELTKGISVILYLLIECNFRIGSERYAKEHEHYGLTTLMTHHLTVRKDGCVFISFVGKKGVVNEGICNNPHVVEYLRYMKRRKKHDDPLFTYGNNDVPINASDVNNFIKNYDESLVCKDIRTWRANQLFLDAMELPDVLNSNNPEKAALKIVAEMLHNTPAVCKTSYVHPQLIETACKPPRNSTK